MNMTQDINSIVAEIKKAIGATGLTEQEFKKAAISLSESMFGVSLEEGMKSTVPFLPSWAQNIPREEIKTGTQHSYKRITALTHTGKSTAAAGTASTDVAYTTDEKTVLFGVITSGKFPIDYEAISAGGTWQDVYALAVAQALLLGRRNECAHTLGGTRTALGAVTNIAAVDEDNVAGTLEAVTYYVNIKALNGPAMQKALLSGYELLPDATQYQSVAAKAAIVDQTDGFGVEGSEASNAPTLNKGMKLTWDPIPGAVGYAIFMGKSTGITNLKCQGVVSQCKVTITSYETGGSAGISGDNSADTNGYDGFLPLMAASGSGAQLVNCGAKLSAAVGDGIPEINDILYKIWQRGGGVDDVDLIVGSAMRSQIVTALGAGASSTIMRINIETAGNNAFSGGAFANDYIHPVTGRKLAIVTDPYLNAGCIAFKPNTIPYPLANIPAPLKMWLAPQYDWRNFTYAMTAPQISFENRMRGGLALYVPPASGLLYNIWRQY